MPFTYEQEIVDRARRLSDNINLYFEEQQYKIFTDEYQQEEITDRYLMNVAIELLISELKEIGIESDQTADDIIEDYSQIETLFALRTLFDEEAFYKTLKDMSLQDLTEFINLYDNISCPEDLLLEIGPWMADKFPGDPMWSLTFHSVNVWYSTQYFADHLSSIRTKLLDRTDPNKAVVNDANIDQVRQFLSYMQERSIKLKLLARALIKFCNSSNNDIQPIDQSALMAAVDKYDLNKLDGDNLPLFAAYWNRIMPEEPDFVTKHHLNTNHHVEYWVDRKKRQELFGIPVPKYTNEIAALIVLGLALDGLDSESMLVAIKPLKSIATSEQFAFTESLVYIDYKSILDNQP